MSDEEKKAIEMLRNYDNEDNLHKIHQSINVVLNLIEKQQTEIEELKAEKDKYYYEWKHLEANMINKIKAKIEELEKGNKNTFIRGEKILVLQSLLEKE